MSFQLLVLRFMSFILRAQYLGEWTNEEARVLLKAIDQRVVNKGFVPDGKPELPNLAEH